MTLDSDVEQLLKDRMRRTHASFKETLNEAIRKGLSNSQEEPEEPFEVTPWNMGLKTGIDPAGLNKLSDDMETDTFLEAAERKEPYSRDRS